jgi:hypothetical protein
VVVVVVGDRDLNTRWCVAVISISMVVMAVISTSERRLLQTTRPVPFSH